MTDSPKIVGPEDAHEPDDASERQIQASNPANSIWLSANAGSGKTRVLTDRVARLLLGRGRAAAYLVPDLYQGGGDRDAEPVVQTPWRVGDDGERRSANLAGLGRDGAMRRCDCAGAAAVCAGDRNAGGLANSDHPRFCATLLRRFPLEAGVSPQFTELDDRAARLLRDG